MSVPAIVGINIVKEMITSASNLAVCREQERTKRAQIEAELEAKLTVINKNYDLYSAVLSNHHEIAMKSYDICEKLLQNSAMLQNPTLLQLILEFIQKTHANNVGMANNDISSIRLG